MAKIKNSLLCFAAQGILCSLLLAASYSCNKSAISEVDPADNSELTDDELTALLCMTNGHEYSEEEINETANYVMEYLDAVSPTTKGEPRTIESIIPFNSVSTKTQAPQQNGYIVNFSNNQGFSILSADRRTDDILLVADSGNLTESTLRSAYSNNEIDNNVLLMLSNVDQLIREQIAGIENEEDALINSALDKLNSGSTKKCDDLMVGRKKRIVPPTPVQTTVVGDWTTLSSGSVSPMITVTWGQGVPYNGATPLVNDELGHPYHQVTGCVATAIAQLLSRWERPTSYNWSVLKATPKITSTSSSVATGQVASLMAAIGQGVNMDYESNGYGCATANLSAAVSYLNSIGFSHPGTYQAYDGPTVLQDLYAGNPVLIAGDDVHGEFYLDILCWSILLKEAYSGHAWVIDGALRQEQITTVYSGDRVLSTTTKYRTLFHCNWGFNGLYNGYYASGAFNANSGGVSTKFSFHKDYSGSRLNFAYNLHTVTGISY